MSLSLDLSKLHPREAREKFRNNILSHVSCTRFCAGYLQSNIACVSSDLADDFERLCISNSSPFPLLYRSKPGEVSVPLLASNCDVRTDLPLYAVSEDGVVTRHVENVLEIPWDDVVTFYFGCSFSFDHMLVAAKVPIRHMIEKQDPPVYISGIPLIPRGSFSGNMVISLRVIPREFVQKAAEVCVALEFAHGAPIHIGAPSIIGVEDFRHPLNGDKPTVGEHDALLFWGCGITATEAMASAKPHIAVCLSPTCVGSLLITDRQVTEYSKSHPSEHAHLSPKVIFLSESPQFASLVSQEAINEIAWKESEFTSMKAAVSSNGLKERDDQLLKSAMTLSHASSVAIVTWYPQENAVKVSERQLTAIVCLIKALLAQDKEITVLAEENNVKEWKNFLAKCESENILPNSVPVTSVALTLNDWPRDVSSTMAKVVDYLGSRFSSCKLNSMIFVNEQGMLSMQNLLSLDEDVDGVIKTSRDHVIKSNQPVHSNYWLNPCLVTMAEYILHTCPIHCRYVRRGRGQHKVKAATEFFVVPNEILVMESKEVDFVRDMLSRQNSAKI